MWLEDLQAQGLNMVVEPHPRAEGAHHAIYLLAIASLDVQTFWHAHVNEQNVINMSFSHKEHRKGFKGTLYPDTYGLRLVPPAVKRFACLIPRFICNTSQSLCHPASHERKQGGSPRLHKSGSCRSSAAADSYTSINVRQQRADGLLKSKISTHLH